MHHVSFWFGVNACLSSVIVRSNWTVLHCLRTHFVSWSIHSASVTRLESAPGCATHVCDDECFECTVLFTMYFLFSPACIIAQTLAIRFRLDCLQSRISNQHTRYWIVYTILDSSLTLKTRLRQFVIPFSCYSRPFLCLTPGLSFKVQAVFGMKGRLWNSTTVIVRWQSWSSSPPTIWGIAICQWTSGVHLPVAGFKMSFVPIVLMFNLFSSAIFVKSQPPPTF